MYGLITSLISRVSPTTASKKLGGGIMHVRSYNLKLNYCRMVVPQREDEEQLETTLSVVPLLQASILYIYIYTQPFIYGWYQDIYQNICC